MAKLDIEWLHLFVAVHQTRSVSRAAERLGMTQAGASIALSKLRVRFADPLFVRTSRGMEPTPFAQRVFPDVLQATTTLADIAALRDAFDPLTAQRIFRICMSDISEIVILPKLINFLVRAAPQVQVEAERVSPDSPRELESGETDLAVGFMPHLEAGFYQQVVMREKYVCLAALDHPRIRAAPSRRQFLAEGHILVTTAGTGHSIVDKVLLANGCKRRILLKVSSFLGVARLVSQTELLVIVPSRLGQALAEQERVRVFEPPVSLPDFAVKQHWHQRFNDDPGNVWLRETVAHVLGD